MVRFSLSTNTALYCCVATDTSTSRVAGLGSQASLRRSISLMLSAVAKGSSLPANTAWIWAKGWGDCGISGGAAGTAGSARSGPGEASGDSGPGTPVPAWGLLTEMNVEVVKESKKSEARELVLAVSPKKVLRLGLGCTAGGGVWGAGWLGPLKLGDFTIWDSKPSCRKGLGWAATAGAWLKMVHTGTGSSLGGGEPWGRGPGSPASACSQAGKPFPSGSTAPCKLAPVPGVPSEPS